MPISLFSIDNLTCKLPRMFQSEWSGLYLSPENTEWMQEPRLQQCTGGWEERGDASKEGGTGGIWDNWRADWAVQKMVSLHHAFAFPKELQRLRVKAEKALVLVCESQGKLLTFSQKEKSEWVNYEMGILPFLEDGIWPWDRQRLSILYASYLYLEELTALLKADRGLLDRLRFKIRHWN